MKLEAIQILEDWTHEKVCVHIMVVMEKKKKKKDILNLLRIYLCQV